MDSSITHTDMGGSNYSKLSPQIRIYARKTAYTIPRERQRCLERDSGSPLTYFAV